MCLSFSFGPANESLMLFAQFSIENMFMCICKIFVNFISFIRMYACNGKHDTVNSNNALRQFLSILKTFTEIKAQIDKAKP